jgi:hypothetical protein
MKKAIIILSAIIALTSLTGYSKTGKDSCMVVKQISSDYFPQCDTIYKQVEIMPQYDKGDRELMRYIWDEILPMIGNPTTEKSAVEIQLSQRYSEAKASDFQYMLSEDWYDFYQDMNTKAYYLKKATIIIEDGYDECNEISTINVHSERDFLLLIKGLIPQNEQIKTLFLSENSVLPGEKLPFEFEGKEYIFRAEAIMKNGEIPDKENYDINSWDELLDYKLYLSEKSVNNEQLVVSMPKFLDTTVQILWVGDLDEDGKPDFILDVSPEYEIKEIVKNVATDGYDFAC